MNLVDEDGTILFADKKIESLLDENPVGKKCWLVYKDDKMPCVDCSLKLDIPIGRTIIHEVNNVLGGKIYQVKHVGIIYKGRRAGQTH